MLPSVPPWDCPFPCWFYLLFCRPSHSIYVRRCPFHLPPSSFQLIPQFSNSTHSDPSETAISWACHPVSLFSVSEVCFVDYFICVIFYFKNFKNFVYFWLHWVKGIANHSSILALRTPWTIWKGKKRGHWKMSLPGQKVSSMLLGKSGGQLLVAPERMKWMGQSGIDAVVGVSGGESKVWCYKEQHCIGTWKVRSMIQGKLDMANKRWQDWTSTS